MAMIGFAIIGFVVAWFASERITRWVCWGAFGALVFLFFGASLMGDTAQAEGSFLYERFVGPTSGFVSGMFGLVTGVASIFFVMVPMVLGAMAGRRTNDWVEKDQ